MTFVVGWLGAVETAGLGEGETIGVFGVSGGVGGAVAQIAHARGAHVIGIDRVRPGDNNPAASVIDEFISSDDSPHTIRDEIKHFTGGRGADVVYDAVGGVTTAAALASLAYRGRLVVISAIGTRTVEIDLVDFYHNETRLLGIDSRKLDLIASSQRLAVLAQYFDAGAIRPLPIARHYGLEAGGDAYRAVAAGTPCRVVIRP